MESDQKYRDTQSLSFISPRARGLQTLPGIGIVRPSNGIEILERATPRTFWSNQQPEDINMERNIDAAMDKIYRERYQKIPEDRYYYINQVAYKEQKQVEEQEQVEDDLNPYDENSCYRYECPTCHPTGSRDDTEDEEEQNEDTEDEEQLPRHPQPPRLAMADQQDEFFSDDDYYHDDSHECEDQESGPDDDDDCLYVCKARFKGHINCHEAFWQYGDIYNHLRDVHNTKKWLADIYCKARTNLD